MAKSADVSADETTESQFWESPPAYSMPPVWSDPPPRPKPRGVRSVGAKLLFAVLFTGVLALLGYEVAHVCGVSWADVRALL